MTQTTVSDNQASIEVPYPFVRETVSLPDIDVDGVGCNEVPTWRPGTRFELHQRWDGEEWSECVADAMGRMVLTVISEHKPGRFPTRVFFTRQWVDPDGKRFGKKALRILSRSAFTALTRGYRHRYEIVAATHKATA
jgi:hypothetical protein